MAGGEKRGREEDEDGRSEGVPKSRKAEVGQSSGSQASNSPSVVGESSSSLVSALPPRETSAEETEELYCASALLELQLRCPICTAYFPSAEALNHHLESHKRPRLSAFRSGEEPSRDQLVPPNYTGKIVEKDGSVYYLCGTCARKFCSFQAYGGHRKNCPRKCKSAEEKKKEEEEDMLKLSVGNPLYVMKEKRRDHPCPVCNEIFSSGPALGGHMRRHRNKAGPSGDKKEEDER